MDGGAWWAAVHGVAKSKTRLSDFTFTFHFPALEKEMAPHSSTLAWKIPVWAPQWPGRSEACRLGECSHRALSEHLKDEYGFGRWSMVVMLMEEGK